MGRKSEKRSEVRISATEASRSFSQILDEVEGGKRFVVHRRGQVVCAIVPPSADRRTASECLHVLRGRAPVVLDEGFGDDLLHGIESELSEERPTWGSSSTRRR